MVLTHDLNNPDCVTLGDRPKYGQRALGPALVRLSNRNPMVRARALRTVIAILRLRNDAASRAQTEGLIQAALEDAEFAVRASALDAIEELKERVQFLPALREMADRDPATVPGEANFPLRVRARKLRDTILFVG